MATVWFQGICDDLLSRFTTWLNKYNKGEVYATRQYLTPEFEKVDRVVQFQHTVPFSRLEMTHLVRILEAEKPDEKTTKDFRNILNTMQNLALQRKAASWMKQSQPGSFVLSIVLEPMEILLVLEVLQAVKEGREPAQSAMDSMVAEKKQSGKGMWQ